MPWLALRAIWGLFFVVVAAMGAGAWIASLLPSGFQRFERISFALLGGLGILSSALFLVGQFSFTSASIRSILTVAAATGIACLRKVFFARERSAPRTRSSIPKIPALIVVSILLVTATSGLAEITGGWDNDAVAYHLLGPKVWLRHGVIRPVLDNSHTAFPQIPETLFAALWNVGGSRAPNFSSFVTFALLLAASASLGVRCGLRNEEAWWVAALAATMPAVFTGAHGCFVDGIFAAFVIAAARIGLDAQTLPDWGLFGMFCGFAIGTKYTGLLAFPALLICVLLLRGKQANENSDGLARKIVFAVAAASIVGAPYYIRNWVSLGCPIYPPPPGYMLFCAPKYFPAEAISQFHTYILQRGIGMGRGWMAFLLLPFNISYHTANFYGGGGIGIAPFALGPIGILYFWKNPIIKAVVLLMFLLTFAWFVTQQESRFLIHVYVMGAILAVLGWKAVASNRRNLSRYLAGAVILISCSYGLFMIGKASFGDVRSVLSARYAEFRRQNSILYLASIEYLNGLPMTGKVLVLDPSVMPYYFDEDYIKPVGQWGERTLPQGIDSLQALVLAQMHQLDAAYVLDVHSEVSAFRVAPNTAGLTLVFEAPDQRVYKIN